MHTTCWTQNNTLSTPIFVQNCTKNSLYTPVTQCPSIPELQSAHYSRDGACCYILGLTHSMTHTSPIFHPSNSSDSSQSMAYTLLVSRCNENNMRVTSVRSGQQPIVEMLAISITFHVSTVHAYTIDSNSAQMQFQWYQLLRYVLKVELLNRSSFTSL